MNLMADSHQAEELDSEIWQLPDLSHVGLKERWCSLFGNSAPKHISRKLMERAIAFRLREKTLGIPTAETKRRLRNIAAAIHDGREESVSLGPRIRPGTRLVRSWQGTTHIVDVETDGFVWQGARHASLSGIAKAITGTNWNGPRFFGLREAPAKGDVVLRESAA